ncbi:GNAT family N-acetyltransferase [Enterobacteriaceae bacterium 4M9]|nr:GNAT family N-acetyltransferase [Enterobacteriaceae bacterium 4M9]
MLIRSVQSSDVEPLLTMLKASGQFDEEGLLHIKQTLESHLSGESEEIWFSAQQQGLVGIVYCAPEVMANDVWNVLMLWVSPSHQRQGVGQSLMNKVEQELINKQTRLLLVETSSLNDFSAARAFYSKQGFINEARIAHYYAPGEDKLIYTKNMQ